MISIALHLSVNELMTDVLGFFLFSIALGTQEVRKKYHLDDDKENE